MESLRVTTVETSIPSDETYKTHLFEASLRALRESCPIALRGIDLLSQRTGQDEFLRTQKTRYWKSNGMILERSYTWMMCS